MLVITWQLRVVTLWGLQPAGATLSYQFAAFNACGSRHLMPKHFSLPSLRVIFAYPVTANAPHFTVASIN
jgi:hypothetical protein